MPCIIDESNVSIHSWLYRHGLAQVVAVGKYLACLCCACRFVNAAFGSYEGGFLQMYVDFICKMENKEWDFHKIRVKFQNFYLILQKNRRSTALLLLIVVVHGALPQDQGACIDVYHILKYKLKLHGKLFS